jgi:hypothetical protein
MCICICTYIYAQSFDSLYHQRSDSISIYLCVHVSIYKCIHEHVCIHIYIVTHPFPCSTHRGGASHVVGVRMHRSRVVNICFYLYRGEGVWGLVDMSEEEQDVVEEVVEELRRGGGGKGGQEGGEGFFGGWALIESVLKEGVD